MRGGVTTDRRAVASVVAGLRAVAATLSQGWTGALTVGARRPMMQLDGVVPPAHGDDVVRALSQRGADPLDLPSAELKRGRATIRAAHREAVQRARRTGVEQGRVVRRGVDRAIRGALDFCKRRITSGALGRMSPATVAIKMGYLTSGLISAAFGAPPPYGILSGRLLRAMGIRVGTGARARLPRGSRAVFRVASRRLPARR